MSSHYDALGVPRNADAAAIKAAYREKSRKHHPDRPGGDARAMVVVNRAYETLSDPAKRQRYDQTGQDAPQVPLDTQALEIIYQVIAQVMDQVGAEHDFVAHLDRELAGGCTQLTQQRGQLQGMITKYEKQMARIRRKSAGENLVTRIWQQKIGERQAKLQECEHKLKCAARAREILADYESTPAELRPGFHYIVSEFRG